ncbi:MAG: hypothetical protein Kow0090_08790 [Myxococcota bacterium]
MSNPSFLKYPFLSAECIVPGNLELAFQEEGYATVAIPMVSETSFDNVVEAVMTLAYFMTNDSLAGNTYAMFIDAANARVGIKRVAGSTNFKMIWHDTAARRGLGKLLGFNIDVADAVYTAEKYGSYHPRYCWIPKRPLAMLEEVMESSIIASRDYNQGVSVTTLPAVFKNIRIAFEALTRKQVYTDYSDEYAALETFWNEAKSGKKLTLYRSHYHEDTDFAVTAVEENTPDSSHFRLSISDNDAHDDYKNDTEMVIISGKGMGQRGVVSDSDYKDADEGYLVLPEWGWTVVMPDTNSRLRLYHKRIIGYLNELNSQLPVSRMNTGAEFYQTEITLLQTE